MATGFGRLVMISVQSWRVEELNKNLLGVSRWHVAQLVEDKIFYYGGEGSKALVEFDTVLGSAREVETNGDGPRGRQYMTSVYAPWRNEIITFGGFMEMDYTRSNETHAFNIQSSLWRKLELRGRHPQARTVHAAVLHGSRMYVYGGYGRDNSFLGDLWIAELRSLRAPFWAQLKSQGVPSSFRTQATIHFLNGFMVVFGGNTRHRTARQDVEIYFPDQNIWWTRKNSPDVQIEDGAPADTQKHIAFSTGERIVYFTPSGIYALFQV